MKLRTVFALTLALTLAGLACGSTQLPDPTATPRVPLGPTLAPGEKALEGEPFSLAIGSDAVLDQSEFHIRFGKVTQDTRCFHMECMRAGAATVSFWVKERSGDLEQEHRLSIGHPKIAPETITVGSYQVEFLDLVPYPGEPVTPKIATLVVRSG